MVRYCPAWAKTCYIFHNFGAFCPILYTILLCHFVGRKYDDSINSDIAAFSCSQRSTNKHHDPYYTWCTSSRVVACTLWSPVTKNSNLLFHHSNIFKSFFFSKKLFLSFFSYESLKTSSKLRCFLGNSSISRSWYNTWYLIMVWYLIPDHGMIPDT